MPTLRSGVQYSFRDAANDRRCIGIGFVRSFGVVAEKRDGIVAASFGNRFERHAGVEQQRLVRASHVMKPDREA